MAVLEQCCFQTVLPTRGPVTYSITVVVVNVTVCSVLVANVVVDPSTLVQPPEVVSASKMVSMELVQYRQPPPMELQPWSNNTLEQLVSPAHASLAPSKE
jgi:isopentenyldiphosphate isomerase